MIFFLLFQVFENILKYLIDLLKNFYEFFLIFLAYFLILLLFLLIIKLFLQLLFSMIFLLNLPKLFLKRLFFNHFQKLQHNNLLLKKDFLIHQLIHDNVLQKVFLLFYFFPNLSKLPKLNSFNHKLKFIYQFHQ